MIRFSLLESELIGIKLRVAIKRPLTILIGTVYLLKHFDFVANVVYGALFTKYVLAIESCSFFHFLLNLSFTYTASVTINNDGIGYFDTIWICILENFGPINVLLILCDILLSLVEGFRAFFYFFTCRCLRVVLSRRNLRYKSFLLQKTLHSLWYFLS